MKVSFSSQSSNMLNQARLKALKVREDHVRTVLDEARKKLSEFSKNTAKYSEVLKALIVQGLLQVQQSLISSLFLKYTCTLLRATIKITIQIKIII